MAKTVYWNSKFLTLSVRNGQSVGTNVACSLFVYNIFDKHVET